MKFCETLNEKKSLFGTWNFRRIIIPQESPERERENPLPHPLHLTSFCAIPPISYTVWTPGTNLSIDKHVHGHNYARGTNRTAIRSWLKTIILATCNDCMFNKELDRFMQSFSRKRQNRASESQALAAGCKEAGTVWNGISLGFWELFAHPNI